MSSDVVKTRAGWRYNLKLYEDVIVFYVFFPFPPPLFFGYMGARHRAVLPVEPPDQRHLGRRHAR